MRFLFLNLRLCMRPLPHSEVEAMCCCCCMRPYFERHRLGDLAPFPVLPAPSVRACCLATVDQWAILPVYIVWRLIHTNIHHLWQFGVNINLGPNFLLYYTKSDVLCIFSSSFALIGNFHLPSFVVVCVGISMTSTVLALFLSATEILMWDFASMGLLEGPHFRVNLCKCTFSFACLSWNLRGTVLFVACLCPSSESVETAPGTTWLKSTYLGQWHCWRHHTLIYHIHALKVMFHTCYL